MMAKHNLIKKGRSSSFFQCDAVCLHARRSKYFSSCILRVPVQVQGNKKPDGAGAGRLDERLLKRSRSRRESKRSAGPPLPPPPTRERPPESHVVVVGSVGGLVDLLDDRHLEEWCLLPLLAATAATAPAAAAPAEKKVIAGGRGLFLPLAHKDGENPAG